MDNIEHIESTTYSGTAVIKIYLQPNSSLDTANAQVGAASEFMLKSLPPGTLPPEIINFSASSVPVLQLGISGKGLSEQQLNDASQNYVRPQLITVPGAVVPNPYGGKQRQVMINMDQRLLQEKGVSATDVLSAVNAQNLVIPSGTLKIGSRDYDVRTNSAARSLEELSSIPIKQIGDTTIYLRDVATVSDGFAVQTNIVRQDGRRSVLVSILKNGRASTLDVVAGVRKLLPRIATIVPPNLKMTPLVDQSVFVRGAIGSVVREAVIAAALTGLMILLFLGSWRSTVIIATSIPALHSHFGDRAQSAARDDQYHDPRRPRPRGWHPRGRRHGGGRKHPSQPRDGQGAEAGDSRWRPANRGPGIRRHALHLHRVSPDVHARRSRALPLRAPGGGGRLRDAGFLHSFPDARSHAGDVSAQGARARGAERGLFSGAASARVRAKLRAGAELLRRASRAHARRPEDFRARSSSASARWPRCSSPGWARTSFPRADSGEMLLHVRGSTGLRIEETARLCDLVETTIRKELPPGEITSILDNIGMPYSPMNTMHLTSGAIGTNDADILISLREGHRPTADHLRELRKRLARDYPGTTFYALPADIVTQILNFGIPAPLDIQIEGSDVAESHALATKMLKQMRQIPGLTDLRVQQPLDYPTFDINVDRTKAMQAGFTEQNIANDVLNTLSGSMQVTPMFFLNQKNGVNYNLVAQVPQYRMQSLGDLQNMPLLAANGQTPGILADLATISRSHEMEVVSQQNIRRVIDIYGSVQDRDLGAVSRDVERVLDKQPEASSARHVHHPARPGADDARFLYRIADRPRLCRPASLYADRDQFPVLAGSVHHHHRASRRAGRDRRSRCSSRIPRSACPRSWARSCAWAWPRPTASSSSPLPKSAIRSMATPSPPRSKRAARASARS